MTNVARLSYFKEARLIQMLDSLTQVVLLSNCLDTNDTIGADKSLGKNQVNTHKKQFICMK